MLCRTLSRLGYEVEVAGRRNQTHDLEVLDVPQELRGRDDIPQRGRYEVKRLRQSSKNSFDRRFKTSGARGSRIYGRHGALIKAAALEIEDSTLDFELQDPTPGDHLRTVDQFHRMLDDALEDRHSHRFQREFDEVCRLPELAWLPWVRLYLESPSLEEKIVSGYGDLDGLIILRGTNYTTVRRDKLTQHIGFDSYGCEGLKLRLLSVVPR